MGCEPEVFNGRPCDLPGCAASTNPSVSFAHLVSRPFQVRGAVRREPRGRRRGGARGDRKRGVVVSPSDTGIRRARAKTDRLDARTLARLAAGSLDAVDAAPATRASSPACLVSAYPRRGLRLRPALADPPQAPTARAHRRRSPSQGPTRRRDAQCRHPRVWHCRPQTSPLDFHPSGGGYTRRRSTRPAGRPNTWVCPPGSLRDRKVRRRNVRARDTHGALREGHPCDST